MSLHGLFQRNAFRYLAIPLYCFSTFLLVQDHVYELNPITGSSMAPTLSPHHETTGEKDRVVWNKWRPTSNLKRGDIVLLNSPRNPEIVSVKRVIGLEGDEVYLDKRRRPGDQKNGRLSEDGRTWDAMWQNGSGKFKIPQGHVWVEGDNWRKTMDSNDYGPVSMSMIRGNSGVLVWPWRQFGRKVGGAGDGLVSRTRVVEGEVVKKDEDEMGGYWELV